MINAIDGGAMPRIDTMRIDGAGLTSGAAATQLPTTAGGASFETVMRQVAGDAVQALKASETVSIDAMHGKATTQAVVDAVMNAERTLQTAVTVRDKVVTAYLEISRMAI